MHQKLKRADKNISELILHFEGPPEFRGVCEVMSVLLLGAIPLAL